jgi:hypothetical protein
MVPGRREKSMARYLCNGREKGAEEAEGDVEADPFPGNDEVCRQEYLHRRLGGRYNDWRRNDGGQQRILLHRSLDERIGTLFLFFLLDTCFWFACLGWLVYFLLPIFVVHFFLVHFSFWYIFLTLFSFQAKELWLPPVGLISEILRRE